MLEIPDLIDQDVLMTCFRYHQAEVGILHGLNLPAITASSTKFSRRGRLTAIERLGEPQRQRPSPHPLSAS